MTTHHQKHIYLLLHIFSFNTKFSLLPVKQSIKFSHVRVEALHVFMCFLSTPFNQHLTKYTVKSHTALVYKIHASFSNSLCHLIEMFASRNYDHFGIQNVRRLNSITLSRKLNCILAKIYCKTRAFFDTPKEFWWCVRNSLIYGKSYLSSIYRVVTSACKNFSSCKYIGIYRESHRRNKNILKYNLRFLSTLQISYQIL